MAKETATGLLVASLVLLIIYGVDAAVALTSPDMRGFLPFDEAVRGGGLGGGAVVMSIIAFVIARKEYARIVSTLLFVNGGLIISGMLAVIAQGALPSEDSSGTMPTIAFTIGMGVIIIGLGGWKTALDRKAVAAKARDPRQK